MNQVDPSPTPAASPGMGIDDQVLSLLHEIHHALGLLAEGGEPTLIDLCGSTLRPGDQGRLLAALGVGEVAVRINAPEDWRVAGTRFPGVWVVECLGADGARTSLRVEVAEVPEPLRPRAGAIAGSAARLEQLLGSGATVVREASALWARVPVLGFAAYSGTGKTTLLKRLIPLLRERGLRLGLVKHAHHNFDPDTPGKDSYELRKAGAGQVLVASDVRWVLFNENELVAEPPLQSLLERFDQQRLDLVMVEGFKHLPFPKIELYRPAVGKPTLYPHDRDIIAVATDATLPDATDLPVLDLNDPEAMAGFIVRWWEGQSGLGDY